MKGATLVISIATVILCSFAEAGDVILTQPLYDPVYPKDLRTNEAIKEFVRLTEENNLNVSVVLSMSNKYKNGRTKAAISFAASFPPNTVYLTNQTLNKEQCRQYLKIATESGLPARVTRSKGDNYTVWTNNLKEVPVTKSLQLLTTVCKSSTGSIFNRHAEPNYALQFTFLVPKYDKNETVKVYSTELEVNVIESQNLSEDELKVIKNILISVTFQYQSNDIPRVISVLLDKKYPGTDWQVVYGVEETGHYLEATKYAVLKTLFGNLLVYQH